MMEEEDSSATIATETQQEQVETKNVSLGDDRDAIKVNIADALNEQDIVKFTVHTKTGLSRFAKDDFQVTRTHEEFVWLFEKYTENPANAGYIIPPPPPRPDFSQSHGKLAKLQSNDAHTTQEELDNLKSEIQSEYLAAFQKTVAMHEVFLIRLATHPVLREDQNLQRFLEYEGDTRGNGKTKKEKAYGFFSSVAKSMDNTLAKHIDEDEYFESQKAFIFHYLKKIQEAAKASSEKTKSRIVMTSALGKLGITLTHLANTQHAAYQMSEIMRKTGGSFKTFVTIEKKLCAKEDLKMTDLLLYYQSDSEAAKDLMTRRVKALNNYNKCDLALKSAKAKGKKVLEAQDAETKAKDTYEAITKTAKDELKVFKKRRVAAFRKGLIQYAQCQIKQSREAYALMKQTLMVVKEGL